MSPLPPDLEPMIQRHAVAAAGVGLLPAPLIDLALITALQLNMLRALAERYDVPFSEEAGRAVLASLIGSSAPMSLSSVMKLIPGVGWALGGLSTPLLAGASTWAVGRVFVQHFESGGTFLSLNPEAVRAHYEAALREGEERLKDAPPRKP